MAAGLSDRIRGRLLAMDLTALRVDDQLRRASLTALRSNGAETSAAAGTLACFA